MDDNKLGIDFGPDVMIYNNVVKVSLSEKTPHFKAEK
jgi:hypothetical protein